MTNHVRNTRTVVFSVAGALLTFFLLSRSGSVTTTLSNISDALRTTDRTLLLLAFALFAVSQVIRAWRWQILSWNKRIEMRRALPLTAVHVGLGHILPVRLSDVALVFLFKKYASVPAGSGAAAVLLAKIMDVVAMGFVVACSYAAGLNGPVVYYAVVVSVAAFVSLFFLPSLLSFFLVPIGALFGEKRLFRAWKEMIGATRVTAGRKPEITLAMLLSIAGWSVKLFMFYSLLRSVGVYGLPVWQIFTAGALTDFTMALPVHGLLSLGTVETGWVMGFALVGVHGILPGGLSVVEAGFTVHLLWLFMALLLMSAGIVDLVLQQRRKFT